ncbi:hypothetical protein RD149_23620 [Gordonia westfalica]|uniref:REDY-like protein HapK n=1 Tax=Gordonia westfalica TaxID=158898 RepID=A0ABU2GZ74_9ACTN|nr:hypothetical protein [Gordonia westfalica]MDS1116736.1 hypothetical protein [Gordonia westfalica]
MSSKTTDIVFFLTVLNSPELRDSYETWVREVDTPMSLKLAGVESYRVVRLTDSPVLDGDSAPSYSYIEIIEVSDLAAYKAAIAGAPASFFEQFSTYIGSYQSVVGSVIN